jgi:hypothetical protein
MREGVRPRVDLSAHVALRVGTRAVRGGLHIAEETSVSVELGTKTAVTGHADSLRWVQQI